MEMVKKTHVPGDEGVAATHFAEVLNRDDSVEKSFNHGWTQINTDWERFSEIKMSSPIGAFYQVR